MLPVVSYHLREELRTLIVCLYNPHDAPETRFTTDNLYGFITGCAWQLESGEPVRRIPFHITASQTDADKAIEDMRNALQEIRKLKYTMSSPADQGGERGEDIPGGVIAGNGESMVTPPNIQQTKKRNNTPYHLWKATGKLYKPD